MREFENLTDWGPIVAGIVIAVAIGTAVMFAFLSI